MAHQSTAKQVTKLELAVVEQRLRNALDAVIQARSSDLKRIDPAILGEPLCDASQAAVTLRRLTGKHLAVPADVKITPDTTLMSLAQDSGVMTPLRGAFRQAAYSLANTDTADHNLYTLKDLARFRADHFFTSRCGRKSMEALYALLGSIGVKLRD